MNCNFLSHYEQLLEGRMLIHHEARVIAEDSTVSEQGKPCWRKQAEDSMGGN